MVIPNLDMVVKSGGKRRKLWLAAFSSVPTMFSKAVFFRVAKTQGCLVNSLLVDTPSQLKIFPKQQNLWTLQPTISNMMKMAESSANR